MVFFFFFFFFFLGGGGLHVLNFNAIIIYGDYTSVYKKLGTICCCMWDESLDIQILRREILCVPYFLCSYIIKFGLQHRIFHYEVCLQNRVV